MPQYYFQIRTKDGIEGDLEGIPFVTLQAAQRDARASLFEMMAEDLKAGHLSNLLGIDITNRLGKVLAVINTDEVTEH
jgi:hypothetical protein